MPDEQSMQPMQAMQPAEPMHSMEPMHAMNGHEAVGHLCTQTNELRNSIIRSPALPPRRPHEVKLTRTTTAAPIVAAVDGSAASTAVAETAVRLAAQMNAPVVFVYVRRGPAGFLGAPVYQHRLTAAMARARRALDLALPTAARAGVAAEGEILEGSPRKRILEFARDRGARLVVVGRRRRKLRRSVSSAVVRTGDRPVVVAQPLTRSVVAGRRQVCAAG
jgi:nucleotide-binding universal stress UspA family protein